MRHHIPYPFGSTVYRAETFQGKLVSVREYEVIAYYISRFGEFVHVVELADRTMWIYNVSEVYQTREEAENVQAETC